MKMTLKELRRKAAAYNAAAITLGTCAFCGAILTIGFVGGSVLGMALSAFGTLACALLAGAADANRFWYEKEAADQMVEETNKYAGKGAMI